ncbi:unnamed protein product [Prunus armeniaca]
MSSYLFVLLKDRRALGRSSKGPCTTLAYMDLAPNLPVNAPLPHAGGGEQSSTKALHKCISTLITTLAVLLPLKHRTASLMAFVVALMVYFGSLAVKILLQAHDHNQDLAEFMDKISLSSGTLALNLELLVIVPAFGCFAIVVWSLCFVIAVIKSYHESAVVLKRLYRCAVEELVHAFDKLKELFHLTREAEQQSGLPS